ncbi:hypothetical protein ACIP98_41475 [Streptomyces sp. NPDC088354]|uniref:hypothetical protein n=1 Tax=Streptomyces sp. NPDC088354 TaxID=3365856 RepID=UPI003828BCB4
MQISDDAAGFQDLLLLLTEHGDSPKDPIPIATSRASAGDLPASYRPAFLCDQSDGGARYRDRYVVPARSPAIAVVLVHIPRTDAGLHRLLPENSDLVRAIAVLARAQQDAVWDRTRAHNRLRSHPCGYYPAILEALADKCERLLARETRAMLAIAPPR